MAYQLIWVANRDSVFYCWGKPLWFGRNIHFRFISPLYRSILNFCSVKPLTSTLSVPPSSLMESKVTSEESSYYCPSKYSNWISSDKFSYKGHATVFQYSNNVLSHQIQIFLPHFHYLRYIKHTFHDLIVYNKENLERQETNKLIWKGDSAALS